MSREAGSAFGGKQISQLFKKVSVFQAVQVLSIVFVFALALAPVAFAQFQTPTTGSKIYCTAKKAKSLKVFLAPKSTKIPSAGFVMAAWVPPAYISEYI